MAVAPGTTYDAALELVARRAAAEGAEVNPVCRSRLLDHGRRVEVAVACLHGYTNCPEQFSRLGADLHALGANVYTPRLPHHGLVDRMNTEQSHLTATELVDCAEAALAVARGLGDRVVVVGLSLGGVLASWLAQNRDGIEVAMAIAPLYWVRPLPRVLRAPTALLARALPSAYVWWDWRLKADLEPPYGYPRLATRGFGAMLQVGARVRAAAKRVAPRAGAIVVVTNAADPGVDVGSIRRLVRDWRRHGATVVTYEFAKEQGLPHDIVDPGHRDGRSAEVAPVLVSLIQDQLGWPRR